MTTGQEIKKAKTPKGVRAAVARGKKRARSIADSAKAGNIREVDRMAAKRLRYLKKMEKHGIKRRKKKKK